MLTMLWLYLTTNDIIKMQGAGSFFFWLTIIYLVLDYILVSAFYNRVKK